VPESYSRVTAVPLSPGQTIPRGDGTADVFGRLWAQFKKTWGEVARRISFWTVVGAAACLSTVYYFGFAESLYESQTILSIQNKSSSSAGSALGGFLGTSVTAGQVEQLYDYIISPDMLKVLDRKYHLRNLYASRERNPFWRLWWPSSDDAFLRFYQNMVDVQPDTTDSLITVTVEDYDARRAQGMAQTILAQSQKFMNDQAAVMQKQTMKFAQDELGNAVRAVQAAKVPYEQQVAEIRLSAAQSALASAAGAANAQQLFVLPVSSPPLPTNTTRPERILDIAGITLLTALAYAVGFLMWANVREHN